VQHISTDAKTRRRSWHKLAYVIVLAVSAHACGSTSPIAPSAPLLMVLAVSPAQGSTFGGTAITITGANFGAAPSVLVGGVAATAVTVKDASTITATTVAHPTGPVDIVVTAVEGRSGTLPNGYTYMVPSIENTPPVIQSMLAIGTRSGEPAEYANVNESLNITASVTDNETPVSELTFEWSADLGSFSGTGSHVVWTAPRSTGAVTLRVKVIERYIGADSSGLPVSRENTVDGSATVSVHDEGTEVAGMAKDFLVLFSQSSVGVDAVLHDFEDGCPGKSAERDDTVKNRQNYRILSYFVGAPRVSVDFNGVSPFRSRRADAWASVDVEWLSSCLKQDPTLGCPAIGATRRDRGVDWVTARYDTPTKRWWLCDSDYEPSASTSLTRYLR
jgi:hypothetical protein